MKQELSKNSILELLEGYKKKKFSPLEVVKEIIKNIKKYNEKLNAFVYFDEEDVLHQAGSSTARIDNCTAKGVLEGIPISIKDLIVTKKLPTTRGSLTSSLPINSEFDAPVVKKLKREGAIILGKTASPEFGHKGTTQSLRFGNTNNPWNISLNAGGSSGGSCAAVAAGLGPGSIGTDGGGSIRIPCSFCGVFGHKPTFGRVPAYPISPFGTIANIGPISRTTKDGALIMNSIVGGDEMDWHSLPDEIMDYSLHEKDLKNKIKVAYSKFWGMENYFNSNLMEKEISSKIENTVLLLSNSGIQVEVNELILWPHNPQEIFMIMWQAGAANLAKKINKNDYDKMDPTFINFIERGNKYSIFDLMDAEAKRAENATHMKKVFSKVDAIIGPTLPVLPFNSELNVPFGYQKDQLFSWLPFTYPFNLTKNPSCNLNVGFSKLGLPIGMQIVADVYKDKICFDLAYFIEQLIGISDTWPTLK